MTPRDVFVIAASRGGVEAIKEIIGALPPALPASLFVVLHIGRSHSALPAILRDYGPLPATQAEHGEKIRHGHIYIAPPDYHMTVSDGAVQLDKGPKEHYTRPAADPLFRSAAAFFGPRVVGIVLTGGDSDGAEGLVAVKAAGGVTVVQDPAEAADPEMPIGGLRRDSPDYCVAVSEMAPLIVRLSGG
jgi:two-component system chemotaxis response regulator CheB